MVLCIQVLTLDDLPQAWLRGLSGIGYARQLTIGYQDIVHHVPVEQLISICSPPYHARGDLHMTS